ncbi:hypothetical protein Tco_0032748 [Tanacetum coccineum]
MAEPILSDNMEKALTESNLSITSNDINIELSKEFLVELRKNIYHGTYNEDMVDHIAKGDGKVTTWEELIKKFFCRLYPKSYDGEDEMLDEGENWGIDPREFLSNRYVDNNILSNNELKKSKYENPSNTATDSFFKAYEVRDIEKQSQTKRKYSNTSNSIDEQPNKRKCKAENFEAIQYSLRPNKEYIAIRSKESNAFPVHNLAHKCKLENLPDEVSFYTLFRGKRDCVERTPSGNSLHTTLHVRCSSGILSRRYTQIDIDHAAGGNLRVLSAEEAWETIEDYAQCDKHWKNPTSTIPDQTIANLKTQLVENEAVRVKIPKCMAWLDDEPIRDLNMMEDKVDNLSPQSTLQVLLLFEVYTPPVTHPEEVEETMGIQMEIEPLNETKLEEVGLNCNHNTPLSSREDPCFDKLEPTITLA